MVELHHGDCLELLPKVAARSVDLVLCDLPYGVTNCAWDRVMNLTTLWREYVRVLKARGTAVLFSMMRFSVALINAAPRGWFRYEWIWDKRAASGWLWAHHRPMVRHEQLLVFAPQMPGYVPQGLRPCAPKARAARGSETYGKCAGGSVQTKTGWPTSILRFQREPGAKPAQKPVALLEYLIRTYTRRGGVVLDNSMGLGSTGVAAVKTGRRFIGMEIDAERFEVAGQRVEAARG